MIAPKRGKIIIEDNIGEVSINIPDRINAYLDALPEDWDVLFDSEWCKYADVYEEKVNTNKIVYKKDNKAGKYTGGASRDAQFYILNNKGATKLYENYLPLGGPPDHWMDQLFRKLDMNVYWSEPSFIKTEDNHITSTNRTASHKSYYSKEQQLMTLMSMEDFLKI